MFSCLWCVKVGREEHFLDYFTEGIHRQCNRIHLIILAIPSVCGAENLKTSRKLITATWMPHGDDGSDLIL
jgi:hypothetical protein